MDIGQLFLYMPVWVMYLITAGLVFAAFEGGFHLGRYWCRRSHKEKDSLAGPMVGATLGLLAFMLSFTFGMAASHFDTRRQLVLDEANAIWSAYSMSGLLAEASCAESQKLLREYVDIRLDAAKSWSNLRAMYVRLNEIQDRLWAIAMAGEWKGAGAGSSWLYVQCLSDMINLQAKRITSAMQGRIPPIIWIVLFALAVCGMAAMGYHAGLIGVRGFFVYQILILTFSLVLLLIYDLDRPRQGLFKVSQAAMVELQQRLAEPSKF